MKLAPGQTSQCVRSSHCLTLCDLVANTVGLTGSHCRTHWLTLYDSLANTVRLTGSNCTTRCLTLYDSLAHIVRLTGSRCTTHWLTLYDPHSLTHGQLTHVVWRISDYKWLTYLKTCWRERFEEVNTSYCLDWNCCLKQASTVMEHQPFAAHSTVWTEEHCGVLTQWRTLWSVDWRTLWSVDWKALWCVECTSL